MKIIFALAFLLVAPVVYGATTLTVNWADNSINEDGFNIERKTGQTGVFAPVGTVAPDVVSFTDPVPDGQLYCYRVNAFNAAGISPWSNEACGQTLTVPLAPGTTTITITITTP